MIMLVNGVYRRSYIPETGKTLIFPAHWEFAHKGEKVVEGTKYVYINHIWFYDNKIP